MKQFAFVIVATLIMAWDPALLSAGPARQIPNQKSSQADTDRVLRGLIDEIDTIMQAPYDKKPGTEVRAVYLSVKDRMKADLLVWSILNDGQQEMLAAFSPGQKGKKPCIELNHALLDGARKNPTLAMTMILHEMKHAHDYFQIGEKYKTYMKNPVERFMYEMDSLFIEAIFIRDFLAPRYKNLTNFERYVLTSLEKDNLASIALVFMKEDMDLIYDLYALGNKLDKGMACNEYYEEFTRLGKAVFEAPIPGEEFNKYGVLIRIKTFTQLAAPLADGAMARNKRCKQNDHKDAIAGVNGYIQRGNAVLREQGKFIDDYALKVRRGFLVFSDTSQ